MNHFDGFQEKSVSLWLKEGLSRDYPTLTEDLICDVCIVGAGITGISTAYRLHQSGLNVVLVDRNAPVHLASGNTTAKFTFQHDLIYHTISKNYDLDKARLYYQSQLEGLNFVRSLIQKHAISCDFLETSAIVYAESEKKFAEILNEKSVYEQLNIPHEIIHDLPLNIAGTGGLKVDAQFGLNPVKYLDSLLSYLVENGVQVFANSEAKNFEKDGSTILVETSTQKRIRCKYLVIATAYPFHDRDGLYFTRLEASRSYLMAFPIQQTVNDDVMMISHSDSPYTLRFSHTDGVDYLVVGGQGHKVGQVDSEMECNKRIIDFAHANFQVDTPAFRWSAQDYRSLDQIPYIGQLTSEYENVFVATGFNKWGMSNGSFSSLLISDLINGVPSKYQELFDPLRGDVKSNLGSFAKSNLNVAKEFVKGKIVPDEMYLNELKNDQGGIVKYRNKRVAAYRDASGTLFLSDSTCTHLGCEVVYNDAERSFDCPCHGSRFNYDGKVIEGAATEDLKKVED